MAIVDSRKIILWNAFESIRYDFIRSVRICRFHCRRRRHWRCCRHRSFEIQTVFVNVFVFSSDFHIPFMDIFASAVVLCFRWKRDCHKHSTRHPTCEMWTVNHRNAHSSTLKLSAELWIMKREHEAEEEEVKENVSEYCSNWNGRESIRSRRVTRMTTSRQVVRVFAIHFLADHTLLSR